MSRTDRIEDARKHLTWLMAERDRVASRNPVDLVRLRSLDAAIDAEIAGAVAAYEDVLAPTSPPTPVPLPPPLHWDHTVRIQAAQRFSPPDVSEPEHHPPRRWVLLACTVLFAFVVTGVLLFTLWPTATTLKAAHSEDRVVEQQPPSREDGVAPVAPSVAPSVTPPVVPTAAPAVAPAQLAAAPTPDEAHLVIEAVTAPEREVHPPEHSAKAKKSKRKRRKRKRRRKRKDRKIKMGNSRDPLSGL